MVARLVAAGWIALALAGCGTPALTADGGGTGGSTGAGGQAGGSSGGQAGGSSGGQAGGSSGGQAGGAGAVDACAYVAGHGFQSVAKLNCNGGINPQAPPCYWFVSFTSAGGFTYYYDGGDVALTGIYVCSGATVTGTVTNTQMTLHGTYNATSGQLDWDQQTYTLYVPDGG